MQENIIGYLLGVLDDDEMAQFESELSRSPDLQARVHDAARGLQVLDFDREDIAPPPGLMESTCAAVVEVQSDVTSRVPVSRRRELVSGPDESWSMLDVMVAAAVVLVACLLFFPAIQNSRIHAQIAGCQDNLRHLGRALIDYSMMSPNETFPEIPKSGNLSVAGFYAPALLDQGLVSEQHNFFCPSSTDFEDHRVLTVPTRLEISAASGPRLQTLQQQAGGDYAYAMGFMKGQDLCAVRNRSRTHFAIMSDAPACEVMPMKRELRRSHMNVLFEYGGVRCLPLNQTSWKGEHLFENDNGEMRAGCHDLDMVMGVSAASPCLE